MSLGVGRFERLGVCATGICALGALLGSAACSVGHDSTEPLAELEQQLTCTTSADCPNAQPCVGGLCCGCVDSNGNCQPGNTIEYCGINGAACGQYSCTPPGDCYRPSCATGVCDPGSRGTGATCTINGLAGACDGTGTCCTGC